MCRPFAAFASLSLSLSLSSSFLPIAAAAAAAVEFLNGPLLELEETMEFGRAQRHIIYKERKAQLARGKDE